MKTIIIIQARMGSSRLPGKVLMPLGDSVVLDYVVARCRLVDHVSEIIIATSEHPQDDAIAVWCAQSGVACFRGSEHDVLSRYIDAAAPYHPDYVVRVTADCPFLDYSLASDIILCMKQDQSDILIMQGEMPRGIVSEIVSYQALHEINRLGGEPRHREHVTYYAYEFPEQFKRTYMDVPHALRYPELRITLDTREDYLLCAKVANAFLGNKVVSSPDVISYLINHPEVAALNSHIEQKPVV